MTGPVANDERWKEHARMRGLIAALSVGIFVVEVLERPISWLLAFANWWRKVGLPTPPRMRTADERQH